MAHILHFFAVKHPGVVVRYYSSRLFRKFMLRFGIATHYIPLDFVTMRMGGASTRNIASRATLLKEDTRACRENGIHTNWCVMSCKYIFKLMEYRPGVFLK